MTAQVVTANRLNDGLVVYLAAEGGWTSWLDEALVAEDEAAAEALLTAGERAVEARWVVTPYLMDVTRDGAAIRPVRLREVIRAQGPTAGTDLMAAA